VAVHNVVAPAPLPEPASHLRSATRNVSCLRSDSRCRRYVSDLSNVTPRYLGSEQKGIVVLLKLTFSSRLASLLLRLKTANTFFVVLSFSFQVWRYSPSVVLGQRPFHCLPITICMHDCLVVSICILSGDGGWQVRDVDVEEKGQIPVGHHY